MLNLIGLFAFGSKGLLQEDQTGGIPWWVILLLLAIVTIVVIWALTRSANFSETDAPHVEHTRSEPAEVAAVTEQPAYVEPAPVITPEPAPVSFAPDNLIVIEGIGPKIAAVLNAAGIQTFAQLADTDPETIRKILFDADPRLARLGDPTTWPQQAKLAAAGDMVGLQTLQDSLKGGRENI
jgi:predicted flap endonuclease-1-like 5' DNA nuclease